MAIPQLILDACLDLLRIPNPNTMSSDEPNELAVFSARIETAYQKALAELTRETDIFASLQQIPAIAHQAVYAAEAGTTRILAVLHNRMLLRLVPSRSLDLLTSWQTAESGEPEEWVMDKLPPEPDGLSGASSLHFAIHPAPEVDGFEGWEGLELIRIGLPVNDDPPPWIYPALIFKTCAIFSGTSTEERDPQAEAFFNALANVWRELIAV